MPLPDRLEIRRLAATYLVAADHPAPETVGHRLDAVLGGIGQELGRVLAPLAEGDDGVWLLRRVEFDLSLDADLPPERVARAWAQGLAGAIARKLDRAADGVVFFPDRTARLARLMADLASGDAWSLWYHAGFAGLKALPVAMALRTAILADPADGLRALARLSAADLARVLDVLGPAEAARVLDGLPEAATDEALAALVEHLETAGWPPVSPACPERLALALLVAATDAAPPVASAPVARAIALLRHRLALGADLTDAFARADAERLLLLLSAPAPLRERLVRIVRPRLPVSSATVDPLRFTPFGGPFMLLRFLDDLPLDALAAWPDAEGAPAGTVVRTLVLAKCAGAGRAFGFILDPVWRELLGLPPALLPAALARWCAGIDRPMRAAWRRALPPAPRSDRATRELLALPSALCPDRALDALLGRASCLVLERFAAHLPGFAGSSPAYLTRNFLEVQAHVETTEMGVRVTLSRPPLDVVLAMTGLARTMLDLPWLVPPRIELRREG
jgi:hypothetical protein